LLSWVRRTNMLRTYARIMPASHASIIPWFSHVGEL